MKSEATSTRCSLPPWPPEPVTTGFNIMVGEHTGLFNGSVPPQYRNGYYRALVAAHAPPIRVV